MCIRDSFLSFSQLLFVTKLDDVYSMSALVQVAVITVALVQMPWLLSSVLVQFGCYLWCSSTGGCHHSYNRIASGILKLSCSAYVVCVLTTEAYPVTQTSTLLQSHNRTSIIYFLNVLVEVLIFSTIECTPNFKDHTMVSISLIG